MIEKTNNSRFLMILRKKISIIRVIPIVRGEVSSEQQQSSMTLINSEKKNKKSQK